jgi:hypothetical protein
MEVMEAIQAGQFEATPCYPVPDDKYERALEIYMKTYKTCERQRLILRAGSIELTYQPSGWSEHAFLVSLAKEPIREEPQTSLRAVGLEDQGGKNGVQLSILEGRKDEMHDSVLQWHPLS